MSVEIIPTTDRAAWLRLRSRDVTASTVGALFDGHDGATLHPYLTRLGLWMLKTGRAPDSAADDGAIRRGRVLEVAAVEYLRELRPDWRITYSARENTYYRDPDARLGATPDVLVECPQRGRGVVQIKSVEASKFRRDWLDSDGVAEVPLWIALQASVEAHLTGAEWAAVCPLVVSYDLEMPIIDVPLLPGVMAAVKARVAEFWGDVADDREPVADNARDGSLLDRIYAVGDPNNAVDLRALMPRLDEMLAARAAASEDRARAVARMTEIDTAVKAALGAAETGFIGDGRSITWRTHRRGHGRDAVTFRQLRYPPVREDRR